MVLPERPISKSQIESATACERRWGWAYLAGLKKSNIFASFGTEVHEQLDKWFIEGKMPDETEAGLVARSGLHHWPAPGTEGLSVERYIETASEFSRYHGYRDVGVQSALLVGDHKTTVDFKWAHDEESLRKDVQFNIYALASMEEWDSDWIKGQWVYYRTRGAKKSLPVVVERYTKQEAQDFIGEHVDPVAKQLHIWWSEKPGPLELKPNPRSCRDYGGCPYEKNCNLTSGERLVGYMAHKGLAEKMREKAAAKKAQETKEVEKPNTSKTVTPPTPAQARINPPEGKGSTIAEAAKSATATEEVTKAQKVTISVTSLPGMILCENAFPMNVDVFMASELIDEAKRKICKDNDVADYRLIEYGKGAGILAAVLDDLVSTHQPMGYVYLDTRTPEGMIASEVFRARAHHIIRGL